MVESAVAFHPPSICSAAMVDCDAATTHFPPDAWLCVTVYFSPRLLKLSLSDSLQASGKQVDDIQRSNANASMRPTQRFDDVTHAKTCARAATVHLPVI